MDPAVAEEVAAIQRHIATFLDELAQTFIQQNLSMEEADYALRFAAGTFRKQADKLEQSA